jgi:hypothetical protein
MKKRTLVFLTVSLAAFIVCLLFSCFSPYAGGGMGTITIGGSARSVVSVAEEATLRYVFTFSGPGGTFERELTGNTPLTVQVVAGTWTITAKAYDPVTGKLRAVNTGTDFTVSGGKDSAANLAMTSASEVNNWTDLGIEVAISYPSPPTPTGREEIIYWRGSNESAGTTISIPSRKITIIAEGSFTITKAATSIPLFSVGSGGDLTLMGDGLTLVGHSSSTTPIISVTAGTLVLDGPTLRDNARTSSGGCGVGVNSGGSFTMKSGTITNNTSTSDGGGVFLGGSGTNTFTMTGGNIGVSSTNKNSADNGGGVYLSSNPNNSFFMSGGVITGNTATTNGAGVYINNGAFTMYGNAVITSNTCSGVGAAGGGVYIINSGTFNMSGNAVITSNTTADSGGGVYISGSNFNMSDNAAITSNTCVVAGGGVLQMSGNFTMYGGTISGNTISGPNTRGGGVSASGNFTMYGGTISGNTINGTTTSGGGVYISGGGTIFTMYGGTIKGYDSGHPIAVNAHNPAMTRDNCNVVWNSGAQTGYGAAVYCFFGSTASYGPTGTEFTIPASSGVDTDINL